MIGQVSINAYMQKNCVIKDDAGMMAIIVLYDDGVWEDDDNWDMLRQLGLMADKDLVLNTNTLRQYLC